MADTLTQLIDRLQALLLEENETFSSTVYTAVIRQALKDLNLTSPMCAADTIDAVSGQYDYELTEQTILKVVYVLLERTNTCRDFCPSLGFDVYLKDDRPHVRVITSLADGDTLVVRYTVPYTISGLDGATKTTLPTIYQAILLDGAAWRVCQVRAASVNETTKISIDEIKRFDSVAQMFYSAFESGLGYLALRCLPKSESTSLWDYSEREPTPVA
jgi:hypothetical protein